MKKIFTIFVSSVLWCAFWIMSFVSILIGITVSLFIPKKYYNWVVHNICRTLCHSVLLFPKIVSKPENLPFPCIYVANHVSFFDLFISGTCLPGNPRGLEMAKHFKMPIYGWFISRFGQIPIEGGNAKKLQESLKNAKMILDKKQRNILVMPEGTRTRNGLVSKFRRGAFFLSRISNVPIVPVVYKNLYKHNNACSLAINPGIIEVQLLEPMYPQDFETDEIMANEAQNRIAKELKNG